MNVQQLLLVTVGLTIVAGPAQAASLTYLSQGRFVRVEVSAGPDHRVSKEIVAPAFEVFSQTLATGLQVTWGDGLDESGGAGARASQDSALLNSSLRANGRAKGGPGLPAFVDGTGRSHFAVRFSIDEEASYALDFELFSEFSTFSFQGPSLSFEGGSSAFAPWTSWSGNPAKPLSDLLIWPDDFINAGLISLHKQGTLLPGDYSLEAEISTGGVAPPDLDSYYNLNLTLIPEPHSSLALVGVCAWMALANRRRRGQAG